MTNLVFEIIDTTVDERRGKSKKTGDDYCIRTQQSWVEIPGKKFPVECTLTLGQSDNAYSKGFYSLSPRSFDIGNFGALTIRPILIPIEAKKAS